MKIMFSWIACGLYTIGAAAGVSALIVGAVSQDKFLITVGVVLLLVSVVALAISIATALRTPQDSQISGTTPR